MSKAKGKGGTGRGTDSKGWTRWKASSKGKPVRKTTAAGPGVKGAEASKNKNGGAKVATSVKKTEIKTIKPASKTL
ncbi:DUF3934 family protein [Paenibacillus sp. N3.4]|uniref:DUF3934 family protein n=1 Tax=Paenibacillus sp. N3.4 TaxID=2603222 RepID=UPI0011CA458D|nr:DUF3934 family protein [Paenibacillus sp. N3.4]TXK85237.1 DUF3934 domain-containing protein [Paenibacillus sp. N3.4]